MKTISSNQYLDKKEEILDLKYLKTKANFHIILNLIILNQLALDGYLVKNKNMKIKNFNNINFAINIL